MAANVTQSHQVLSALFEKECALNALWLGALQAGRPPDMDVYDAATLSTVIELSGRSIAAGSAPQPFPDFTRGRWREPRKLHVMRTGGDWRG